MLAGIGITAGLCLGGAIATAAYVHHRDRAQMRAVWTGIEALCDEDPPAYDPAMVAGLPAVAERYFARAIAPGTPLHRIVRLTMEGRFILNGTGMPMAARQILAPPATGFVWQARIGAGLMRFAGSDGYRRHDGAEESWTKFWLHGLIPLARIGGTADHARAAATRAMLESVWVPAALLPQHGAVWRETGPDSAEVRFADTPDLPPMHLTFDAAGDLAEVWALRWTDANREKTYRWQPFGGRMIETGVVAGFRIPTRVELANLWGTPDEAPFFMARITDAVFRPEGP